MTSRAAQNWSREGASRRISGPGESTSPLWPQSRGIFRAARSWTSVGSRTSRRTRQAFPSRQTANWTDGAPNFQGSWTPGDRIARITSWGPIGGRGATTSNLSRVRRLDSHGARAGARRLGSHAVEELTQGPRRGRRSSGTPRISAKCARARSPSAPPGRVVRGGPGPGGPAGSGAWPGPRQAAHEDRQTLRRGSTPRPFNPRFAPSSPRGRAPHGSVAEGGQ